MSEPETVPASETTRPQPGGAMPRSFLRSATANYVTSFASLLLALLVTPILVRGLGKEAYGTWTLVTTSVLYYSVLGFGLSRAAVKFVAEANAAGDLPAARRVVSTSFIALSAPALLLIALSPVLALVFPLLFDFPPSYHTAVMVLVILSTIDFAIGMPCDTFGASLVGLQRFDLLNAATTGTAVAQATSWGLIVAFGGGLIPLAIATVSFSLLSNVVRYAMVRRLLHGVHIGRSTFDRRLIRPLVSMSSWIALSDAVEIITLRIDPLVVGLVAGVPAVAVYAVGQKLAVFVERLTGPALSMFFPHAAELSALDADETIRRTLFAGTRLAIGLTLPLALTISLLAQPAIRIWVGPGFDSAALVAAFLSLTTLTVAFSRVGVYILRGLGDVAFAARVGVLEAVVNLGMSIALGQAMGAAGVALGTLIGVVLNHMLLLLPYVCRKLDAPLWALLASLARAHVLPLAAGLAVGFALRPIAFDGILGLAAAGAGVLAVYAPLFALTGMTAEERQRIAGVIASKRPGARVAT